jgi:hypothetical protein
MGLLRGKRYRLEPIDDFVGGILVQECFGPIMCGPFRKGRTYVCGHCGQVLAKQLAEDQVWDQLSNVDAAPA